MNRMTGCVSNLKKTSQRQQYLFLLWSGMDNDDVERMTTEKDECETPTLFLSSQDFFN